MDVGDTVVITESKSKATGKYTFNAGTIGVITKKYYFLMTDYLYEVTSCGHTGWYPEWALKVVQPQVVEKVCCSVTASRSDPQDHIVLSTSQDDDLIEIFLKGNSLKFTVNEVKEIIDNLEKCLRGKEGINE